MGSCWSRAVDHTRHWRHASERVSRRLRILEAVLKGEMTTRKLERVVVVAVFDIRYQENCIYIIEEKTGELYCIILN